MARDKDLKVPSKLHERWKKLAYKKGMKLYAYTRQHLERVATEEEKSLSKE